MYNQATDVATLSDAVAVCFQEFMFYSLFSVLFVTCAIASAIVDHNVKDEQALDAAIVSISTALAPVLSNAIW